MKQTRACMILAAAAVVLTVAAPLSAQEATGWWIPDSVCLGCRSPIVPRPVNGDAFTRTALTQKTTVRGQMTPYFMIDSVLLHTLPVDDPREVAALLPGVFTLTDARRISVRGGSPEDLVVYVDGVLVRNGQRGTAELLPGTNGIGEMSLWTGLPAGQYGEALSGLLTIITPAGGNRLTGDVRYRTDDVGFDAWRNVGFNRIEATISGPLRGGVTFFTALTLDGRRSLESEKLRDVHAPVYVASGVDTVIRQPATVGDPLSDTIDLAIPRFVQYSGYCNPSGNYGVECQGLRVPFTARGAYAWQAKLQRPYSRASRVSLTGLAGLSQEREFPGSDLYNPVGRSALRERSRAAILDWKHDLTRLGGLPLGFGATLSYQSDDRVSGPLTGLSELDSRDPFGGFLLAPLDFLVGFDAAHDVSIAGTVYRNVKYLDDRQLQCLLVGVGYCQDNVPFPNRNDLLPVQPYRMNPYAVEQSARFPLWTRGLDGVVDLSRERRFQARTALYWQPVLANRLRLGAEYHWFDSRRYTANPISTYGTTAYAEQPVRQGAWIEDRTDLGRLLLVGGLRWDRFDSRAYYPRTPGRISSDTLPFDPNDATANLIRARAHAALSPRVQAALGVAPGSNFRVSFGRQVQMPAFDWLFQAKNTDLSSTSLSQAFGRDLGLEAIVMLELGFHRAFSRDIELDVAAYTKTVPSGIAIRLVQLPDPSRGGATTDFRVYDNIDLGSVRGVDVKLDGRVAGVFSGWVAYSYDDRTGATAQGRQAIAGSAALTFPEGWRAGSRLGPLIENTSVFATFRLGSNRRYTREQSQGLGGTAGEGPFNPTQPLNASALPWFKTVDIRVGRGFTLGRVQGEFFAESHNLFNWTNLLSIFTETGTVTNDNYRAKFVYEQSLVLMSEAGAVGLATIDPATGEPAVDLSPPGVCAGWFGGNPGAYARGPADCVLLERAERRFGNGDGLFSQSEFTKAFDAWYDLANAPYRFYGPGRRIRVGMEFGF